MLVAVLIYECLPDLIVESGFNDPAPGIFKWILLPLTEGEGGLAFKGIQVFSLDHVDIMFVGALHEFYDMLFVHAFAILWFKPAASVCAEGSLKPSG